MTNLTIHSCIKACGKAKGCRKCPVMLKGFCLSLVDFIHRAENNAKMKYPKIYEHDRRAIITDTVSAIVANINTFEGRKGSRFSTWAWRIYMNKIADFFRKEGKYVPLANSMEPTAIFTGHSLDEQYETETMLEFLKSMLKKDPACCKLLVDFYYRKERGETQKEMAASYGINPNTFNQRLKRCRTKLRKILSENK